MTESVIRIFLFGIKVASFGAVIILMATFVNLAISMIQVVTNGTVLSDIFNIVQLWLPFNLGGIMATLLMISGIYLSITLMFWALSVFNKFTK